MIYFLGEFQVMGQANQKGDEEYKAAFEPTGLVLFHEARACYLCKTHS
jgi:hypothetical protein